MLHFFASCHPAPPPSLGGTKFTATCSRSEGHLLSRRAEKPGVRGGVSGPWDRGAGWVPLSSPCTVKTTGPAWWRRLRLHLRERLLQSGLSIRVNCKPRSWDYGLYIWCGVLGLVRLPQAVGPSCLCLEVETQQGAAPPRWTWGPRPARGSSWTCPVPGAPPRQGPLVRGAGRRKAPCTAAALSLWGKLVNLQWWPQHSSSPPLWLLTPCEAPSRRPSAAAGPVGMQWRWHLGLCLG